MWHDGIFQALPPTPVLTRHTTDEKDWPAAASSGGTWSRVCQWFERLFDRHEPPPQPSHKTGKTRRASTLCKSEVDTVRRHLSEVLDQHPQARDVMKYVRVLERGLEKKGRFALDDLPVEVIRRALEQLDPLVSDWSATGLSTLRSKAAVAIASRDRVEVERAEVRRALRESDVQVEEASVTTFMQANEEWERSFPRGAADVPAVEGESAGASKRS